MDAIVDDLKESVKRIMDYPFPHPKLRLWKVSASSVSLWEDLIFVKLPSFIPSSRYTEELAHFRSLEEIPGCIHLPSANAVSTYFLSAPKGYIHIIVQPPTTCVYFLMIAIWF